MAYVYFQNNPIGKNVGDCAVRAVSKAMDMSWEDTYLELAEQGFCMADMPNSTSVYGGYLFLNGFRRISIDTGCPDCFTVSDFCEAHPYGTYVLVCDTHAVCVKNGNYYDSFDSGNDIPAYAWEKAR